ncbi:MAG: trehalose-phosphatase [Burkholderiaceae bacterium]
MNHLFTPEGKAALERLAQQRTLYGFDFDGTLAPIVARPDNAFAHATTERKLSLLGALVPIAILTGRSVADMRQRIEFTPLHLIGNHGAEGLPAPLHHSLADSLTASSGTPDHGSIAREWLHQWPAAIAAYGDDPGIFVEDKTYSISIHYRLAADREAAERAVAAAVAKLVPTPRLIGGKCVFNLLPEGAPDKGNALASLVRFEHCDAAFYIGDDETDEAVFHGAPAHWVTVHVGVSEDSAAGFFIEHQGDIDRCLDLLIANAEAALTNR